ncbi:MAG: RNA-binding protein [Candidatus Sulfopaludibacter sp.]|nr:RNA-binding protein [Candidatus Sulfopaludibacter sp.]
MRSLFEPLGTVRKLKLMTDSDTGLSRGFAFVEMTAVEAGHAIAALHGRTVDGQTIEVREGRPKLHSGVSAHNAARQPSEPRL